MRENMGGMMEIYKPFLEKLPKLMDFVTAGAIMPIHVAKCTEGILLNPSPNARYLVGWEAWIIPSIWWLIPDKWRDFVILKLFNFITK